MVTPMPPHPGNTGKDHHANTGHQHHQRALGKGEACGMLNRSGHTPAQKSWIHTSQGIPRPSASSSLPLQHNPSSRRARAPAPSQGKELTIAGHPRARFKYPSARSSSFSHPSLVPVQASALTPGGLFLTRATQPSKNPLSALYLGRFGRRKARRRYRLKRRDPLSPTVIRQTQPGESRRQNGDGVKATARAGKNKTQGQGQTKDVVVLGGAAGCTPSPRGWAKGGT